jgi:hypothetical protein
MYADLAGLATGVTGVGAAATPFLWAGGRILGVGGGLLSAAGRAWEGDFGGAASDALWAGISAIPFAGKLRSGKELVTSGSKYLSKLAPTLAPKLEGAAKGINKGLDKADDVAIGAWNAFGKKSPRLQKWTGRAGRFAGKWGLPVMAAYSLGSMIFGGGGDKGPGSVNLGRKKVGVDPVDPEIKSFSPQVEYPQVAPTPTGQQPAFSAPE